MRVPDVLALFEYWRRVPTIRDIVADVAAFLGIKYQAPAPEASIEEEPPEFEG